MKTLQLLFCLIPVLATIEAAKILLFPIANRSNSRLALMKKIGKMIEERGHHVSVLVNDHLASHFDGLHQIVFPTSPYAKTRAEMTKLLLNEDRSFFQLFMKEQLDNCKNLLAANDTFAKLKWEQFDVVIVDLMDACSRILVDYLDTPSIVYSFAGFSDNSDVFAPIPVAYVPSVFGKYTDDMSFFERLKNAFMHFMINQIAQPNFFKPFEELKKKLNINTSLSMVDSFKRASLVACNAHFALDYPRPLMPHVQTFGGMFNEPARRLDSDLGSFIDDATDGLVVVSFGSLVDTVDASVVGKIASALGRLPYKVIWKYSGELSMSSDIPDNVRVMTWIPQNDLLGHKNVKVFVTHAGISSTFESVYHGVPVVSIPLFCDQHHNANKLVDKLNMGIKLNSKTFTSEELYNTIIQVINNPIYFNNARLGKERLSDHVASPKAEFLHRVDSLARSGNVKYLRSKSSDYMSNIRYFLIDILAFVCCALLLLSILCFLSLKWLLSAFITKLSFHLKNSPDTNTEDIN
ncbi:unnamed protein product [Owenia fusiformis]|uniref:UDP-glucuronosyltransferase n=1 Tax=Owenia fusiformis TaxID=6347 RepID=A0A8J1T6U7_OWEFU|nr:unnamed protein product [Owenia fusiformis]